MGKQPPSNDDHKSYNFHLSSIVVSLLAGIVILALVLVCVVVTYYSNLRPQSKVKSNTKKFDGTLVSAQYPTYYVSNSGNDSNPGTEAQPWKTVAKVNATNFQPGDSILFKRGGVWEEMIECTSAGAENSPIVYGAYGDGEMPLIRDGFHLDEKNYVTIENLHFHARVEVLHASHTIVDTCFVELTAPGGDGGINIGYNWGSNDPWIGSEALHGNIVRNSTVTGNRWSGIELDGRNNDQLQYDFEIYNNHTYGNGTGIYVNYTKRGKIYNNHSHDNTTTGGEGYGLGIWVGSDHLVFHNDFHDNRTSGIEACGGPLGFDEGKGGPSDGNRFYQNKLYRNGLNNYGNTGGWDGIFISGPSSKNTEIANNLIYDNLSSIRLSATCEENCRVYHNTFTKDVGWKNNWNFKNNIYFDAEGPNSFDLGNNFEGNPQFVNRQTYDFHLASSSPVIDRGLDVGILSDFDDQPRPQGSGYDIGAVEYAAATPPSTPTPTPSNINNVPVLSAFILPAGTHLKKYKATMRGYDVDTNDTLSMVISGLPLNFTYHCSNKKTNAQAQISCSISGSTPVSQNYTVEFVLSDSQGGSVVETKQLVIR